MDYSKAAIGILLVLALMLPVVSAGNIEEAAKWAEKSSREMSCVCGGTYLDRALYYQNMEIISLMQKQNALLEEQNQMIRNVSYQANIGLTEKKIMWFLRT